MLFKNKTFPIPTTNNYKIIFSPALKFYVNIVKDQENLFLWILNNEFLHNAYYPVAGISSKELTERSPLPAVSDN